MVSGGESTLLCLSTCVLLALRILCELYNFMSICTILTKTTLHALKHSKCQIVPLRFTHSK